MEKRRYSAELQGKLKVNLQFPNSLKLGRTTSIDPLNKQTLSAYVKYRYFVRPVHSHEIEEVEVTQTLVDDDDILEPLGDEVWRAGATSEMEAEGVLVGRHEAGLRARRLLPVTPDLGVGCRQVCVSKSEKLTEWEQVDDDDGPAISASRSAMMLT